MNINQEIRYALMFLSEMNKIPQQKPMTVRQVVDQYGLSEKFMEQVVSKLKKAGILWSTRGRSGGYGLKHQGDLTVSQVFHALGQTTSSIACPFPNDCHG